MNVIQFLGQGIVAENKNTNEATIRVYLPTINPEASGAIRVTQERKELQGVDSKGNDVKATVLRSNSVPATWRAFGEPNRITPPDVREGTPVMIYTVTGTGKYYWTTWGQNLVTFKLETVIWGWSANPELTQDTPFNIEDYYTVTVSTHTGQMSILTTDKNGEKTVWALVLDAMNGVYSMVGANGTNIEINDVEQSIQYANKQESIFCIDKKNAFLKVKDEFILEAEKSIGIFTKKMSIGVTEKIFVKCPETEWIGNITQKGKYTQTGNYIQTGNYDATGNLTRSGNETISGSLLVGGGIASGGAARTIVKQVLEGYTPTNEEVAEVAKQTRSFKAGAISASTTLDVAGSATIGSDATIGGKSFLGHKHGNGNNGSPTTAPM